ncbi:hypothetical protein M9458_052071 [Cirrhinus mrigala]|uniref:Uncharacterized protein n=1 Tax=Cirrhinus mrigala TaxID=683832 RepID=A0ABD0MQM3_CIRMR
MTGRRHLQCSHDKLSVEQERNYNLISHVSPRCRQLAIARMSDDEATEFYEDEDETFEFDGRPYLFEPEYTEEELRERRERREIERQRAEEAAASRATTQPRITGRWWCSCRCCEIMPTDMECFCCKEWDLLHRRSQDARCVTLAEGFSSLLDLWVLEAFFHVPKLNWARRPTPEGPDGHLSTE